jgi:hypothetical protein
MLSHGIFLAGTPHPPAWTRPPPQGQGSSNSNSSTPRPPSSARPRTRGAGAPRTARGAGQLPSTSEVRRAFSSLPSLFSAVSFATISALHACQHLPSQDTADATREEAGESNEGKTLAKGRCLSGDGWFSYYQEDVVYL